MKHPNYILIGFLCLFGIMLYIMGTGHYHRGSLIYTIGALSMCVPILDATALLVIPRWRRNCASQPYGHLAVVHVQTLLFWWATGVAGCILTFPPASLHPSSMEVIRQIFTDLSLLGAQLTSMLCHYALIRWACRHPLPIPVLALISAICPLIGLLTLLIFTVCSLLPA
jgi:hypothetical protein